MIKFILSLVIVTGLSFGSAFSQEAEPVVVESTPEEVSVAVEPEVLEAGPAETEVPALAEPAPIEPPGDMFIDPAADPLADPFIGVTEESATTSKARDFIGEDLPTVLRLLARQARRDMVVSDMVIGTITLRLEDRTPMEAIRIVVQSKGLVLDETDGVLFVKTDAERAAEPTESAYYQLSYARAENVIKVLQGQLQSKATPLIDARTNTIFYRETRSNLDAIRMFLETVDRPTRQVMIEARLIEVTANPRQTYGINWTGVFGGQTIQYGWSPLPDESGLYEFDASSEGQWRLFDGLRYGESSGQVAPPGSNAGSALAGQFAILSLPQLSATLSLINQDADAEFLAHPRIVTADNQEATIKIVRSQPVPQLNFNEQTATTVFGGFEDKEFGNTLVVRPSINKEDFITLSVKPEISNKVRDEIFEFAGTRVASPIIDTRALESNVLIRSGDTLAIGGLLQDEQGTARVKVPILGDIPLIGYLFQERSSVREKRNLLVFVTPTIIQHGEGTGLENQAGGLFSEENTFADPGGWRNNARGAWQLPGLARPRGSLASEYPLPGQTFPAPGTDLYRASATSRE